MSGLSKIHIARGQLYPRLVFDIICQFCWPSQQPLTRSVGPPGWWCLHLPVVKILPTQQNVPVVFISPPLKPLSLVECSRVLFSGLCSFLCTGILLGQLLPHINWAPILWLLVITAVYDRAIQRSAKFLRAHVELVLSHGDQEHSSRFYFSCHVSNFKKCCCPSSN